MTKREAQEITMALVAIEDARRAVAVGADAEIVPVVLLYRRDEPDYVVTVPRPAMKERE